MHLSASDEPLNSGKTGYGIECVLLDPDLPIPSRAHHDDAGIDLYSVIDISITPGERVLVPTGIAIALKVGTVGLIHPRSGLAYKQGLTIVNTPGTIDAGYRGEIKVCLTNIDRVTTINIHRGDRIAQLIVQKIDLPTLCVVSEFSDTTVRGDSGYGSSGGHHSL